jgi:hypothetical protein
MQISSCLNDKVFYTYVADGESTTGHIFNGQLVVASLVDATLVS